MLSISDKLREESVSGAASPACRLKCTLKSGKALDLTQSALWEGGFVMDDSTSSSGSFDIGQVITNQLTISLDNSDETYSDYDFTDAVIVAYRGGILSDGTTELLQCGIFNVDEYTSPDSEINLTCLDNMIKTEFLYSEISTAYPASLQTIVLDICTGCGLTLATSSIPNGSYVVQARPDDDTLTCREMLHYVAEISGCYVRCDYQGRIVFTWYDLNAFDNSSQHDISAIMSLDPDDQDIIITGIQVTDMPEDDDDEVTELYGEKGYVLEISDNPLIEGGKAEAVAAYLGKKIIGMQFRPLTYSGIADPSIEAGDAIEITDWRGKTYRFWATGMTYTMGGETSLSCGAESPGQKNSLRLSDTTKAIIETRKKIRQEKEARQAAIDNISEQLGNASGLYITAETQSDGSTIYYTHDKPTLEGSTIVCKYTSTALGISTDGGKTYPYGLDVSGTAILNRIYAVGIDADYINTGSITAKDSDGNIVFKVDIDTGEIMMSASSITTDEGNLEEYVSNISNSAADASTAAAAAASRVDSVQTATEALTTAIKEYVKSSDFETYKQYVTSQLSQTPEAITARFESIEETVSNLDDETKTALNEMATYIRADANGLTLGKDDDPITLNINNGQITFYQNGTALAYFNDNQLYVSHLAITDSVDLCGLVITKDDNYITIS